MGKNLDNLETYINRNGYPMIRRCRNCIFWKNDEKGFSGKMGLCSFKPIFFAYTLEPSVFPITKEFCLCENHKFEDESKLAQVCDKVLMKDIIRDKRNLEY